MHDRLGCILASEVKQYHCNIDRYMYCWKGINVFIIAVRFEFKYVVLFRNPAGKSGKDCKKSELWAVETSIK